MTHTERAWSHALVTSTRPAAVTAAPTVADVASAEATANRGRGSYWITTFGCQMNKADSERMAGILESMGYREAEAELDALFI